MPKGLIPLSPLAARWMCCWPYAPSLIPRRSASATLALKWKRGEYNGTRPATFTPMRCANVPSSDVELQGAMK